MGSVLLHEPWGPYTVVLPFALFIIGSALAAGGDRVALPVATVAGAMTFQTHTSYVLLYPGITAVAWAGAILWTRRAPAGSDERKQGVRWLGISLGVTFLSWLPPIIDQIFNRPGNIVALWRAAQADQPATVSAGKGLKVLAGTVTFPPWWLPPGFGHAAPVFEKLSDGLQAPAAIASILLVVAGLGWALRDALRRDDRVVMGLAATSLALLVVGYATILRAPWYGIYTSVYVRFLWPTSLLVWFTLGLAAVRHWVARTPADPPADDRRLRLQQRIRRVGAPAAAAVALVVGIASVPDVDNSNAMLHNGWQDVGPDVIDAVVAHVEHEKGPVLIREVVGEAYYAYAPLVMAELDQRGIDFVVDDRIAHQVGERRAASKRAHKAPIELVFRQEPDPLQPGELIFRSNGLGPHLDGEVDGMTTELQRTIKQRGRPRLAGAARDLLAKGAPETLAQINTMLAKPDLTFIDVANIAKMVGIEYMRWPDGSKLDGDLFRRWQEVQVRQVHAQVAVYLIRTP
jgi:hypothetical protein